MREVLQTSDDSICALCILEQCKCYIGYTVGRTGLVVF